MVQLTTIKDLEGQRRIQEKEKNLEIRFYQDNVEFYIQSIKPKGTKKKLFKENGN